MVIIIVLGRLISIDLVILVYCAAYSSFKIGKWI
jgi:hypothetical protein